MNNCDYCDEEFKDEKNLKIHLLEEHEDEISSHEKDEAKKAKRQEEDRKKQVNRKRKRRLYQGIGAIGIILLAALVVPQVVDNTNSRSTQSIDVSGDPVLGESDAAVTVVEYGDFQCPACKRFQSNVFPRLKQEYIDTGEVKFVWKDFPLTQYHDWAEPAAESMECIYREDEEAFWEAKNSLFAQQSGTTTENLEDRVVGYAEEEGLNGSQIRSCIESGTLEEVRNDKEQGAQDGVRGTPTVFVDGEEVDSSYRSISDAIERKLEG